jgi:hypothetical protein
MEGMTYRVVDRRERQVLADFGSEALARSFVQGVVSYYGKEAADALAVCEVPGAVEAGDDGWARTASLADRSN